MFFRDAKEICMTIDSLLTNDVKRNKMSNSDSRRVWDDVVSRMQKVLDWINEVKGR